MKQQFENKIKNLMPRKNSRFHQGIVPERLLKKYVNSKRTEPIIYRSGLELKFIEFCECNPKIQRWVSEPFSIQYFSRLKNKVANYYPDYVIENTNGEKIIVEVKPTSQTIKPSMNSSEWDKEAWIVNCDKWKYAKQFAEDNNMKFIIVTEKFFE